MGQKAKGIISQSGYLFGCPQGTTIKHPGEQIVSQILLFLVLLACLMLTVVFRFVSLYLDVIT